MELTKAEAVRMLREVGLYERRYVEFAAKDTADVALVRTAFPNVDRLVARTSLNSGSQLNLPRIVDADPTEVAAWSKKLPTHTKVLVEPYEPLLFCGQIAIYPKAVLLELVTGIWELGGQCPVRLLGDVDADSVRWTASQAPLSEQRCIWQYELDSSAGNVEDWMIRASMDWIEGKWPTFRLLRSDNAIGLKFHFTAPSGFSAQNLYLNIPDEPALERHAVPIGTPTMTRLDDDVPTAKAVELAVDIPREEASALLQLIARVVGAGVQTVYIRSGLLSHLAISLREAGLQVRNAI